MQTLPPVPGVIKVEFKTQTDMGTGGSRLHFAYTGTPPTVGQLNTMSGFVAQQWSNFLASHVHASAKLVSVQCIDLTTTSGNVGVANVTDPGTSTAINIVPGNSCVLITHKIARRYRGGKPRTYLIAGAADNLQDEEHWTPAFVNAMQTGWNNFISAIVNEVGITTSLVFSNVSYYHDFKVVIHPITGRARNVPQLRTDGPLSEPIAASFVSVKPGSFRPRINE